MIFENEIAYDNWFDFNEEKEGGHNFIEDRVVIVKGTRTIQNRKFNGFSADATINCKNVKTAIRRFIKELKSNGFNISEDEFESNCHCFTDCGYVVEIEEIDEDRFYINYMCYQNEVEEEIVEEVETEEPTETEATNPVEINNKKSEINSMYGITANSPDIYNEYNETKEHLAEEQFERLTGTLYKSLFKAIGIQDTRKISFTIANNMVFFNYNGIQYKYYPSQCKVFKKCGKKYQRINWKDFAEENNPVGQKQFSGRSPPLVLI